MVKSLKKISYKNKRASEHILNNFIDGSSKMRAKRALDADKLEKIETTEEATKTILQYCEAKKLKYEALEDQRLIYIDKENLYFKSLMLCVRKENVITQKEALFFLDMFQSKRCFPFFCNSSLTAVDVINNYLTNGFSHLIPKLKKEKILYFNKKTLDFMIPKPI
jgi:hypothetical protein